MSANRAAALRTLGQVGRVPGIGRLARAKSHLRCFAFRNTHINKGRMKAELRRKATGFRIQGSEFGRSTCSETRNLFLLNLQFIQRFPIMLPFSLAL